MNLQNQLDYDPTLFDNILLPPGLNADLVKSNIMLECGLLTPLYSEPSTMKAAIQVWFLSRQWEFDHLLNIINAEYNPIENYDRYENSLRNTSEERGSTETQSGSDKRNITTDHSGTDTTTRSVDEGDITTENEVSAFNSATYSPDTKSITTDTQVIENALEHGESIDTEDNVSYGKRVARDDDMSGLDKFTSRIHGNVGVTTNQQMINQELELLAAFNIYQWIAKQFRINLILEVW